jgi:SAM-dependent methyltransferase
MEHVMEPGEVLQEWRRVLVPGGRYLLEWFPYKGPWGPQMESLIPVPWAHVVFGERAMLEAAAQIYDHPAFVPRHWDLDDRGRKMPNKWRAWRSFKEQGYINKLGIPEFRRLAESAGFAIDRLELHSFDGGALRRAIGGALMHLPLIGEYFVSYSVIELRRR